jgi:hypothetical protein
LILFILCLRTHHPIRQPRRIPLHLRLLPHKSAIQFRFKNNDWKRLYSEYLQIRSIW